MAIRRSHRRGELQDLCRKGPRPHASPRRHRDHGQSRQSQSQSGAPAHSHRRGQALLPAEILAGLEPDRAGLRQDQALLAQGRRALRRNHLHRHRRNPRSIYTRRMRQLLSKFRLCANLKASCSRTLQMNQQTKHGELAARIRAAYAGVLIAPIRTQLADLDVDAAYAIQQENTAYWQAEGRRLVGSKIGLTSRAVQKQLGVDRPDFGVLFADMIVAEDQPVAAERVLQPKIEAEVAFLLDRDVDVEAPTIADVLRAVAYAMPALEIVGSRITNWDIGIVDTVADNASSGLFVLGGPVRRLDGLDLRALQMQMTRREEVVSKGTGAACLGNPLNAMVWLAGELARRKRPLRAGEIVLSGALGPMVPVNPGDAFEATIAGLGSVSARFA